MPSSQVVKSIALALFIRSRLSATNQRHRRRRLYLRRILLLTKRLKEKDRPPMYCRVDATVPILRIWRDEDAELRQDFGLSRRAMNSLQRLLDGGQDHGWGSELEVLIYTYWLAHGLSYRVVSRVFSVPKASVHRIIHRVAHSIWNHLNRVIAFPQQEELQAVGQGFVDLSGSPAFRNIVGAIDGSHIRIKPPQLHPLDYLNPKNFYSINMQAICDAKGIFLDIFVGYPGSVHDTRIMRNSTFYQTARYPPPGYAIVGDGGYPCLQTPVCLLTPYEEPVAGPVQQLFNLRHSKARSVTDRAFGMMKTRWRSTLFQTLEVSPTFAPQVIASCAFIHNVCLTNGDTLEPDEDITRDDLDPRPPQEPTGLHETSGDVVRDTLAAHDL